jgi:hypothetical protein
MLTTHTAVQRLQAIKDENPDLFSQPGKVFILFQGDTFAARLFSRDINNLEALASYRQALKEGRGKQPPTFHSHILWEEEGTTGDSMFNGDVEYTVEFQAIHQGKDSVCYEAVYDFRSKGVRNAATHQAASTARCA